MSMMAWNIPRPKHGFMSKHSKILHDNNKRAAGVIPHWHQRMMTWVEVGLHRGVGSVGVMAKSGVNIIVAKAAKTSYHHPLFIDNLNLLWPWDDLTISSKHNCKKTAKTRYFELFSVDLTLPRPLDDLVTTSGYPNVMAMSKDNISVLFGLFLPYHTVLA